VENLLLVFQAFHRPSFPQPLPRCGLVESRSGFECWPAVVLNTKQFFPYAVAYNRTPVTKKPFTAKQGQYLAFIFYYTKIRGFAPSESDMQNYFKVSPPSVHQMVVTLEANGFIERVTGRGRSIRVLIPRAELPDLE